MKRLVINAISLYRRFISSNLPNHCRYYPSCSQYAIDAIERYGLIKGGLMAVLRVLRCNQLFKGGIDPVK